MGFNQLDGRLEEWPDEITVPLYWTILDAAPRKAYKQEHVINGETGNKLYTDGTDAVEPYDLEKDFQMQIVKHCEWIVKFGAYYSYGEAQQFISQGKKPRDTVVFRFTEKQDEMIELVGQPLQALYSHPLLLQQIPEGWIPDE